MKFCFIKVSFVATLIYELLRKQYNIMSYQQKQQTATTKSSSRTHRNLKAQTPANIYLFKVNNKNSRKMSEICSKLIIKVPEQRYLLRSVFFTVNFEHISVHFYCYF